MSEEVADVIDGAADVLDREGWVQHRMWAPEGRCIVGALEQAGEGAELFTSGIRAKRAVERELFKHRGEAWRDLPHWNDEAGRTAAEVTDLLRAAAKRQR